MNQHFGSLFAVDGMRQRLLLVVAVAALGLMAFFLSAQHADAALIDRVNEAIRDAEVPTTVTRSNAFQLGVHIGHYTTYEQLVGAILYHKANGTLPEFSISNPVVVTECITGDVLSLSPSSVSLRGDIDGNAVTKTIEITQGQYDVAVTDLGITNTSNVTVCSTDSFYSQYGHMTKN